MDEQIQQIFSTLEAMKETLIFLVEQEKIRGEEVKALNEKIEAVNDTVVNQIVKPAIEQYQEQQFSDFGDKYGERLRKYDDLLKTSLNEPEYDSAREAWNEYSALPEEERGQVDIEKFVDGVEQGLTEYVNGIKAKLGIPADTAVEVKDDGNGNVEVKADENGDGKPETKVEDGETKEPENGEDSDIDPELAKELEAYASKK